MRYKTRDRLQFAALVVVAAALVGLLAFGTLWAYDFDIKCLIAECRRVK